MDSIWYDVLCQSSPRQPSAAVPLRRGNIRFYCFLAYRWQSIGINVQERCGRRLAFAGGMVVFIVYWLWKKGKKVKKLDERCVWRLSDIGVIYVKNLRQRTKGWTQPGCGVGGCEIAGGEQNFCNYAWILPNTPISSLSSSFTQLECKRKEDRWSSVFIKSLVASTAKFTHLLSLKSSLSCAIITFWTTYVV